MNPQDRGLLDKGKSQNSTGRPDTVVPKDKLLIYSDDKDIYLEIVELMKKYYGIKKAKQVSNSMQLIRVLERNPILETLVIYTHGIPGSLLIKNKNLDLDAISRKLSDNQFKINNIFFEGCNVLEGNVQGTILLGNKLNSRQINGFNYAHYFQKVIGITPKEFVNFSFFQNYFAIGSKINRSSMKSEVIWFEWFYPSLSGPNLFKKEHYKSKLDDLLAMSAFKRTFKQRSKASLQTIYTYNYQGNNNVGMAGFEEIRLIF